MVAQRVTKDLTSSLYPPLYPRNPRLLSYGIVCLIGSVGYIMGLGLARMTQFLRDQARDSEEGRERSDL